MSTKHCLVFFKLSANHCCAQHFPAQQMNAAVVCLMTSNYRKQSMYTCAHTFSQKPSLLSKARFFTQCNQQLNHCIVVVLKQGKCWYHWWMKEVIDQFNWSGLINQSQAGSGWHDVRISRGCNSTDVLDFFVAGILRTRVEVILRQATQNDPGVGGH